MTRPTVLLTGVLLTLLCGAALAEPKPAVELVGIWAGCHDLGPEIRGSLTLTRDDDGWTAEIAGRRVKVDQQKNILTFQLAGDDGAFRGRLDATTRTIHGQWTQSPVTALFGQRFATPVRLAPEGPTRWQGRVDPIADRSHVYFVIEQDENGRVRAFLRNPQTNFGRLFDFSAVDRDGDRVRFHGTLSWRTKEEPRVFIEGLYHESPERLSLFIEDLGGTFDLIRLGSAAVSDFYPRSWTSEPYRYAQPPAHEDGWPTADLSAVGMAVEPIETLVRKIVSTPIDAVDAPYIDALLIARQGKLVVEEYFHGHHRDAPHDTRSASKSLTSTLVGAVIHARDDVSLDTLLYSTMLERLPEGLDARATRIDLEDLLTMTPGFACDDWDDDSPGGEDRMQQQTEQPDWYRYTLDLPMLHEPGAHPAYCSASPNLAGGVLARALGEPLTEIFDAYLGRPLGLERYHTNLMPTGEAYAGGGLRVTARDFLKFGQLMLDDGVWNGTRILDPGWSAAAIEPRHTIGREQYGYGWWMFDYEHRGKTWPAFYAGGNGGNYIIGVPGLDLVIVIQASNYSQRVMHRSKYEYVPEFILESVAGTKSRPRG